MWNTARCSQPRQKSTRISSTTNVDCGKPDSSFDAANSGGRAAPPSPPNMPTRPPAAPTSLGKYSGMYLNTDALPMPIAQPSRKRTSVNSHTFVRNGSASSRQQAAMT